MLHKCGTDRSVMAHSRSCFFDTFPFRSRQYLYPSPVYSISLFPDVVLSVAKINANVHRGLDIYIQQRFLSCTYLNVYILTTFWQELYKSVPTVRLTGF